MPIYVMVDVPPAPLSGGEVLVGVAMEGADSTKPMSIPVSEFDTSSSAGDLCLEPRPESLRSTSI